MSVDVTAFIEFVIDMNKFDNGLKMACNPL